MSDDWWATNNITVILKTIVWKQSTEMPRTLPTAVVSIGYVRWIGLCKLFIKNL